MELWLSLMSMVMWLMILLTQKRTNWTKAFVTVDRNKDVAGCTFYEYQNRPVLPSNPVIPPITYDTPPPKKSGGGRKSHQFENVERRTYHPEIQACTICKSPLRLRSYLNWRKHIQTLTTNLYVSSRGAYCDACQNSDLTYLSKYAAQLSLPNSTYGLDVLVRIGYLRDYYRLPYHLIAEQLPSHIKVSTRHLSNLYQEYLALLACAQRLDLDKLKSAVKQYGGLIYAVDGLEPEGGQPQLWSVREVLTGTLLAAGWVARVNQDTLAEFLAPVKALNLPLLATLSDKQPSLILALEKTWKNIPHQYCQAHYLTNAADPLYKSDQQMKTQLRKQVRAAAGATMREAQAKTQKKPNCKNKPLVMTGLAAQPPQELDEIRKLAAQSRSQVVNHESNQLLDTHDAVTDPPALEPSNEQMTEAGDQKMADQPYTFDHNTLETGPLFDSGQNREVDEQKQPANPARLPLADSGQVLSEQAIMDTQIEAMRTMANDDRQFEQAFAPPSISTSSSIEQVQQEVKASDELQQAPEAPKSSPDDLFCGAVQTESVKPARSGQSEPVFTQAQGNQINQESAEVVAESQSVLEMVRAKLAETPVVVFDRGSNNCLLHSKDLPPSSANCCNAMVSKEDQTDELVATYAQHLRRVLSGSGRKPYKFGGLRLYSDLLMLLGSLERSLEHLADESRLECFANSIREALLNFEQEYSIIAEGYSWLLDISSILDSPLAEPGQLLDLDINLSISGAEIEEDLMTVRQRLDAYLDWLKRRTDLSPLLLDYRNHLCGLTERYAKGLFNCYQIAGLPRTNNGLESHFGALRRRTLCTAGPYQAQQTLHEKGAWLLLDVIENEHQQLRSFQKVALEDWQRERERIRQHHSTFTNHRRFRRDPQAYLDKHRSQK